MNLLNMSCINAMSIDILSLACYNEVARYSRKYNKKGGETDA